MMTKNQFERTSLSILLVGVGGQGTILASDILAEVGLVAGYQVKKAEVHGMSQRGGSVVSHVRWGSPVFSPVISQGEADMLVAFEKLEAIRFVNYLRPEGLALVNDHRIVPITVSTGNGVYPDNAIIQTVLDSATKKVHWVAGEKIAGQLGNTRAANVVVLGALSALLELSPELWLQVIEGRVPPKYIDLNRQAFWAGRETVPSESIQFITL